MSPPRPTDAGPLLGIDTMVLIYHFEGRSEHSSEATELLHLAEAGRCRLVASVLSRLETLVLPKRHGHRQLEHHYTKFFELFPNLEVLPVDEAVAEVAADLRAAHDLRTPEALHLATALHRGAGAFVTEDRRHFPSEASGVPVVSLQEALTLVADHG